MRGAAAGRWVWTMGAVGLVGTVVATLGGWAAAETVDQRLALASFTVGAVGIGAVGVLLTLRRPANPIGWVYLGVWTYYGLSQAVTAYAQWATTRRPPAPGMVAATWVTNWSWVPMLGVLVLYPMLLFPTGTVPSRRWRWVPKAGAVVITLWTLALAVEPSQYSDAFGNLSATANPATPPWGHALLDVLPFVSAIAFTGLVMASLVGLTLRFRRGDATTRAQLKWFFAAATVWVCVLLYPGNHGTGGLIDVVLGVAIALMPLAMAIAILRYRLYDIDRLISRTASYLVVTGAVVLTYVAVVTSVTRLVGERSSLAVAAATLAAAALARPALRRVQRIVDRRFNRAGYDAARTVDAFGSRLRDQTDPDSVLGDLTAVVVHTLQPSHATITLLGGS